MTGSPRPQDGPCDFCERPTALEPGGDGLILAAVTNDGPDSFTLIEPTVWWRLRRGSAGPRPGRGRGRGARAVYCRTDELR